MEPGFPFVLTLVAAVSLLLLYLNRRARGAESDSPSTAPRPERKNPSRLYELARAAADHYQASASPDDLTGHPAFVEGMRHLRDGLYSDTDLVGYLTGDNAVVACMAMEALARRRGDDSVVEPILAGFNEVVPWTRYFALRALDLRAPPESPILGRVLTRIDASWSFPANLRFLREFVRNRVERGEKATFGDLLERIAGPGGSPGEAGFVDEEGGSTTRLRWLSSFLPRLGEPAQPLVEELRRWSTGRVDEAALRSIGNVWGDAETSPAPVTHPSLERRVAALEAEILRPSPRSVLLVGETGTGKTVAIRALARRLREGGFTIFEAGHTELLAGMSYVGQLEERLRKLAEAIGGGRPVVWVVPQFHALSWAGKHQFEQSSMLDYLLPRIERGEIRVVGETTPAGYQRLLHTKPRCRTALHALTLDPLPSDETLQLARDWIRERTPPGTAPIVSETTLGEAWNLAQQFMGTRAAPGNLLELLSITMRRMQGGDPGSAVEIRLEDLISTLGSLTGLPASILDDRASLNLTALRATFDARVMGQPEAVECLVERVAMIKAGVTDPSRPQGVFLLAGPTGTGKTEIAKALASFLFGSPDRMIRLDMSEFQDEGSLARIFGDPQDQGQGDSLIDQIRKQPFSVVLLDEFEKANYRVWDLFLQVFDDGRLTDRLGRTADFRHALILMTSNLGGRIPSGLGLGFLDRTGAFSAEAVRREVDKAFRREFLNRIDRVIVFRPLERETMRAILRREIDEVYRRRGLRNRPWAVEWDDAALEFLLEKGFTADLGARPLKRAIDRYLLSPLARTIVDHRFPEGDQFLFVTSTGTELQVRFVDPDAPAEGGEEVGTAESLPGAGDDERLTALMLSPRGAAEEVALLRAAHDRLTARASAVEVHAAKDRALQAMSAAGFWDSADRFTVLGRAEYLDRIESSLDSARSLIERLEHMSRRPANPPRDLVGRVAQSLWLLEHAFDDVTAGRPVEAWLLVDAGYESGATAMASDPFARRLGEMYRGWARRRGMRWEVLDESSNPGQPYRLVLSVSGFAAWALLESEDGLHVWEEPGDGNAPARRSAVRVRVAPQPDAPVSDARAHALRELGQADGAAPEIVRRYRETPSPLVRDARRGWRTGLLDRVLAGEFDLIG